MNYTKRQNIQIICRPSYPSEKRGEPEKSITSYYYYVVRGIVVHRNYDECVWTRGPNARTVNSSKGKEGRTVISHSRSTKICCFRDSFAFIQWL